ncbi:hypothetical protein A2673_02775 [Candidatus Kaiserbacteria bacterium RIFCSPHIGHO2_01_FULL_50_13]|uniref:DoxX family protein n=1 Tax=Candidatus Kaiserbacteria bacterium RIFCSPLOWO2_01_FULL_50_24 TaxID=1798507 RepID=A0A1F6ERA3_9BACT|nr:MAG: hypothetical protein A2673_02775 [Candidatus Kaiserbacteria bacterium RIFCSPHIGHO2_01_FULL_50_13]OGG76150.1 MAG: hypothetical protein A3A34_01510 [Candidatus Kaiserbacteria bacterium RIFCSPLOWO2_01_FULL_50_24]OGG81173.1 MAG: hypothetical protein A3H74_01830 [Candidatus Kaiserbacteria bacterium RIFCSPLOWO2_02_FULL_51_13]
MLSIFPELLFLAPLAPFLLRVALAGVFGYAALRHFVSKREDGMRTLGFVAGWLHAFWMQPAGQSSLSGTDGNIGTSVGRWAFKVLWVVEAVIAIIFVLGAYTQLVALIGGIVAVEWMLSRRTRPVARGAAFLSLVMCLSLLLTGAGALAFDLPL